MLDKRPAKWYSLRSWLVWMQRNWTDGLTKKIKFLNAWYAKGRPLYRLLISEHCQISKSLFAMWVRYYDAIWTSQAILISCNYCWITNSANDTQIQKGKQSKSTGYGKAQPWSQITKGQLRWWALLYHYKQQWEKSSSRTSIDWRHARTIFSTALSIVYHLQPWTDDLGVSRRVGLYVFPGIRYLSAAG